MKCLSFIPVLLLLFIISIASPLKAQTNAILVVQDSAALETQLDFLQERTRVYNNFRAIREDIFQKMKKNAIDSLNSEKLDVARLKSELIERNFEIETLNTDLARTKEERDQSIRTKDSFSFLGMQVQKGVYNMVMWIAVLGLLIVAVLLFLMFKRSFVVTNQTKSELENIQKEYDEYRKSSREKYEKLVVSHHNDMMRLKRS